MQTSIKYRNRSVVTQGTRMRRNGLKMGMRKTLGDGGCIHFLDCEDAFINVYISLTHLIAHLNVQFM